ncbi:VOC family protein [Pseudonocardia adelaidensis]|uniref:VOC family protein n=1 Tax=Pseudonocardia adelaidensis TaxID=648754 RepID=A0ABP9NKK2_9PSEU
MHLENVVWDARDPRRLGRFWAAALDAEPMTDRPECFEARMILSGDAFLDLCFQRVAAPSSAPARLHLDLAGGARQRDVVERLVGLGATHTDIGQGEVPWVVLADPEGNAFCVMEDREAYRGTGPIAALPLDSADPDRDAAFWAEITGWIPWNGTAGAVTLRHPSGAGPLLELCPEPEPKRGKNPLHLDVRADPGDGDPSARLTDKGARQVSRAGELPWLVFTDPSGNEFCVLPAPPG